MSIITPMLPGFTPMQMNVPQMQPGGLAQFIKPGMARAAQQGGAKPGAKPGAPGGAMGESGGFLQMLLKAATAPAQGQTLPGGAMNLVPANSINPLQMGMLGRLFGGNDGVQPQQYGGVVDW